MVCDWGMSERLGPMSYGPKQEEIFLGRDIGHRREYSDRTAEAIDEEIKALITEAAEKARKLLKENTPMLHAMAEALLEHEVLDDLQLDKLMNGEKLEPPSKNGRNQAHGEEPEAEEKAVEEPSAAADQGDVVITDEPEPEETKEPSDD